MTLVDLVRGLATLLEVSDFDDDSSAAAIAGEIGRADHYVLVLVDGFGTALFDKLAADAFVRRNLRAELRTVFPSTTAAALTTLATGQWPAVHGIPGWWTHLPDHGLTITTLPFVERFEGTPLQELGVTPEDVFPIPGFWNRVTRSVLTVVPHQYVGTVFSEYSGAGTAFQGYDEIADGFAVIAERVATATAPTFSYLYLPQVDDLGHKKGVAHPDVELLLNDIDRRLGELADGFADEARLIVTADHGLVDTPEDRRLIINADNPLLATLECPPSMEQTVPAFHVRPGLEEEFRDLFSAWLGDYFTLVTTDEADERHLFGPMPMSPVMRSRIGTFIAIADEPTALYYRPRRGHLHIHVGVHAGLSRAEMFVPLVVAGCAE